MSPERQHGWTSRPTYRYLIVGALVGGFLASALFNSKPIDGPFDISSIVVSVIGAVIVVLVVGAVTGRSRAGRGSI